MKNKEFGVVITLTYTRKRQKKGKKYPFYDFILK